MDLISELSIKLLKFKHTGSSYTFRCVYCGDSSKNNYKTRAYIFTTAKGNLAFKCQNCGVAKSINHFLQDNFPDLHKQYIFDNYKQSSTIVYEPIVTKSVIYKPDIFKEYPLISELHKNHPAKLYLINRKLPKSFLSEAYYIKDWKKFTNKYKHTYNNTSNEESRIVVPLVINGGDIVGFQGRLFGQNDGIRYITIMLNDAPKIYGIDLVDFKKPVYITEGIYDSLFVYNCIAMLGSDLNQDFLNSHPNTKFIFLFDNEPKNNHIINRMNKVVKLGHSVCIWSEQYKAHKDLNDCVIAGVDITPIVDNHYSGLRAKLEISKFAKL